MKRFLIAGALTSVVSMFSAAYAVDVNREFPNPDGSAGSYNAANIHGDISDTAYPAPTKYKQKLFDGANGAPVYRRPEKSYTGEPDAAIASAQCDFALNTKGLNSPQFGVCPERKAERILDKEGTNYNAPVRVVTPYPYPGADIWHTDGGSGQ